jgi:hypothetical protein
MRKRKGLHFIVLISILTVGTVTIKPVGETLPWKSHALWGSLAPLPAEAAGTIFVDASASGAGTGVTWSDAFTTLQDAFAAASIGDQIWVAAGVYYPDEGWWVTDDDRDETFTLLDGWEIYGGFIGSETNMSQRDWTANVTVLSGDIEQDDTTDSDGVVTDVADIAGSNAYHVVTTDDGSAVLDGFTVTAGLADGVGFYDRGGGMINTGSSPILANVKFIGNLAVQIGGGMYNTGGSSAHLTNVRFINNLSNKGGGVANAFGSSTLFTNVIISGNEALYDGGGMYNIYSSNPLLTNVIFSGNLADQNGGGLYNFESYPAVTNVTITGNFSGTSGGGMYNFDSGPTLTNSILWNNQAGTAGSQVFNSSSTPDIAFSEIQGCGGSGSGWDTALGTDGGNNIDADPLFITPVDPATTPTTAGDLHLQIDSPTVDTGDNGPCLSIDLDGNKRPIDGDLDGTAVCDMGAYEKTIDLFLPLIMR